MKHGVNIIDWQQSHEDTAAEIKEKFPTDLIPENDSDERDALILATAFSTFSSEQVTIVCGETKLRLISESKGYKTIKDVKDLVEKYKDPNRTYKLKQGWPTVAEISESAEAIKPNEKTLERLRSIYPELNDIYTPIDEGDEKALTEKLAGLGASDQEIRIDILAYTQVMAPISKQMLYELMKEKASIEIVTLNAERLKQEGLIEDTGSHWIPNIQNENARQICLQAMTLRLDELVLLMEGG